MGSGRSGLIRLDTKTGHFNHFRHEKDAPQSLADNDVGCIIEDDSGNIWAGNAVGLNMLDQENGSFSLYRTFDKSSGQEDQRTHITSLLQGNDQDIWVGTIGKGLFKFNPASKTFTTVTLPWPKQRQGFNSKRVLIINDLLEDKKGFLWVATNVGLFRFPSTQEPAASQGLTVRQVSTYLPQINQPGTISDAFAKYLLEDQNGTIWVGTKDGLNRYDRASDSFIQIRHNETDDNILSYNNIYALYEDRQGNIWVSTSDGLNRLSQSKSGFTLYENGRAFPDRGIMEKVTTTTVDPKGIVWMGSTNGYLAKYDPLRKELKKFRILLLSRRLTVKLLMQFVPIRKGAFGWVPGGRVFFILTLKLVKPSLFLKWRPLELRCSCMEFLVFMKIDNNKSG